MCPNIKFYLPPFVVVVVCCKTTLIDGELACSLGWGMDTTISEGACVGQYACDAWGGSGDLDTLIIGSNTCTGKNSCFVCGNQANSVEIGSNSCAGEYYYFFFNVRELQLDTNSFFCCGRGDHLPTLTYDVPNMSQN